MEQQFRKPGLNGLKIGKKKYLSVFSSGLMQAGILIMANMHQILYYILVLLHNVVCKRFFFFFLFFIHERAQIKMT